MATKGWKRVLKWGLGWLAAAALAQAATAAPVLWVSDSDGTLGRVDLETGTVSIVGQMAQAMTDIAFNAQGELWGVDAASLLYRIDRHSAATSFVAGLGQTVNALVFDAAGTLSAANDRLMTVDTRSGAVTLLGTARGGFRSSGDLAFVAGNLYLSSLRPVPDTLFRLDATTGAAQAVGTGLGVSGVYGLATDDNAHLYGLTGHSVVRIDPATGRSQWLLDYRAASGLGEAWGTAFTTEAVAALPLPAAAVPVPEPPSALLLGAGLWWALRRLRRPRDAQVPPT